VSAIAVDIKVNKKIKQLALKLGKKLPTLIFYVFVGIVASLGLTLFFYWSLSLNSSFYTLINTTKNEPVYLFSYLGLTLGTIILFGINVPLFIHRWRKYGLPKFQTQAGSGLGVLVGLFASACPVCGSLILSAIGLTAGLAAFPFQGLELKALSFLLMALSLFLTGRELRRFSKGVGECPVPKDPSLKAKDIPLVLLFVNLFFVLVFLGLPFLRQEPFIFAYFKQTEEVNPLYAKATSEVLPAEGFSSKISLKNSVLELIENGVIDKGKFEELYTDQEQYTTELEDLLNQPSEKPILLTKENYDYYLNLLWALGLANYMSTNEKSPIQGSSLFRFSSTGGWILGKAKNGGEYFNKFKIVELTADQEELVTRIASNTYRPCCNNSTFFQDCNHGSALLGVLQLGASQGLSEDELYKEALAFNSFWFPDTYIQINLYLKLNKGIKWEDANPKEVLGFNMSSASGWGKNIVSEITKIPGLVPRVPISTDGCGV